MTISSNNFNNTDLRSRKLDIELDNNRNDT